MDLREAGIAKGCAAFIGSPDSGAVRTFGVRGKKIDVSVAAGAENDGVGDMRIDLAGDEVAGNDAAGFAVDDDEVEHLMAREQGDASCIHLPFEGLISAEKELLAGLAPGVEGSRDLGPAKAAIGEGSAVFAGEGDALSDALIDDIDADLGEAINVGLAGAEVSAFDGVVEQAIDAVAVVLIIFRRVDSALRGDGMRPPRRILEAETLDVVAEFGKRRRGRSSGEAAAHDDDRVFTFVRG